MQFKIGLLRKLLLSLVLLAQHPLALAAASCTINVIPFTFGLIVTNGPPVDSDSGSINVVCTGILANDPLVITTSLSPGANSTNFSPRKLRFGSNFVDYNLYTSPSRVPSSVWGDGTNNAGPSIESISNLGSPSDPRTKTIIIYGRVFGNQGLKPAGLYTDSINVLVTF